jgi:hypothetical protein
VQSKKDSTGAANVTLDSSVTTGNLIVVGVSKWNQFISSTTVSDNKGNTYYKAWRAEARLVERRLSNPLARFRIFFFRLWVATPRFTLVIGLLVRD